MRIPGLSSLHPAIFKNSNNQLTHYLNEEVRFSETGKAHKAAQEKAAPPEQQTAWGVGSGFAEEDWED